MNIYKKVKYIAESTLADQVADYLDIDVDDVKKKIKLLTFSDYLDLAQALKANDDKKVRMYIEEGDNPFGSFGKFSKPSATKQDNKNSKEVKTGDEVNIQSGDESIPATVKSVSNDDVVVQTHKGTERVKKDEIIDEDEINRIKALAGVKETTSAGCVASVAMPLGGVQKRTEPKKKTKKSKK